MPFPSHLLPSALLLVAVLLAGACESPRVHRQTDFHYMPKAADAPIDLFVGELTRPYDPIATIDSQRYESKEAAAKAKMLEELERMARPLGADAVQNVRLLHVRVRGIVGDEKVPVPGAWHQGVKYLYFLRGQAVKYVDQVGLTPTLTTRQPEVEPAAPDTPRPERRREPEIAPGEGPSMPIAPRRPEIAEPEEPMRATPGTIREPAVAGEE